jgi:AcrR family transcriptional regulator
MGEDDDQMDAKARIANRRSLRLVGRASPVERVDASGVLEGPELVGPVTEIPARSRRAEPIRAKLMDAAEILFARWGYTGVSIRDVTDLAGTRLANVTYYFGSKQNLYIEVLKRRAAPLSEMRLRSLALNEAMASSDLSYVKAWVDSYVDPAVKLLESGDPGWDHYLRLIAHVAYSRLWPATFNDFYNDAAAGFMASLRSRFPDVGETVIQHAFLMLTATSMYTLARTGRVETFQEPAFASDDIELLAPLTKRSIVGGLVELLNIRSS